MRPRIARMLRRWANRVDPPALAHIPRFQSAYSSLSQTVVYDWGDKIPKEKP